MYDPRIKLATLAAIGATLPVAIPAAAQAQPVHTSSLAGTTSAMLAPSDLRSPDARDAATPRAVDLRSPDARDSATPRGVDLRSPDARDTAIRRNGPLPPRPVPSATTTVDDGVDWGDVDIVGGASAAVLALFGGALMAGQRRRHHHAPVA